VSAPSPNPSKDPVLIYAPYRLDIDYEYPDTPEQSRGYVELLKELRHGLDAHAQSKGISYKYPLTVSFIRVTDLICYDKVFYLDCCTMWSPKLREAARS